MENKYKKNEKTVYLTKKQTKGFYLTGVEKDYDVYSNVKGDTYLYYGKDLKKNKYVFEKVN